jgi:hypothetical protein
MKRTGAIAALAILVASGPVSAAAAEAAKPPAGKPALRPVARAIPETGVLGAADLVALIKLGNKAATDQFADDPTLKYVGREVSITVGTRYAKPDYDRDRKFLVLETSPQDTYWELGREISTSQYSGVVSVGLKRIINKQRGSIFGVEVPSNDSGPETHSIGMPMENEAARQLSQNAALRIKGRIRIATGPNAKWRSILSERRNTSPPTLRDLTDRDVSVWTVAVDVDSVEWIDTRTGAVLKAG